MTKRKKIKIEEKKLGRERAWGQMFSGENKIQIDPRLKAKRRLTIVIHECLHVLFPNMSETIVDKASIKIGKVLWEDRYRRIER